MAYHPFGNSHGLDPKGPSKMSKAAHHPRMEFANEGDSMQVADPDSLLRYEDDEGHGRTRTNPEVLLREQLSQLQHVNDEMQDEHTRLESQIKKLHEEAERLFEQKMRVEGQIEMIQVTHKSTAEQLRMFQDREKD